MKGIILMNGYPAAEKFYRQSQRIATELRVRGVEVDVRLNGELLLTLAQNGKVLGAEGYDFAVYLDKDKYTGRLLEKSGLRLFNSASSVEACDDKLTTYLHLAKAEVPIVQSIPAPLCYTKTARVNAAFLSSVEKSLTYPLIAKKSYGSFGAGVRLVRNREQLEATEREWLFEPHFYQSFINQSFGKDIRVIVIGGKVFAAMERVAQAGEFRSNVELGGVGRAIELSPQQVETAERAALALGLDYCGVDLLEGETPIVCEVNSNAFFEGLEAVTGKNVAAAYAEHIIQTLKAVHSN